jgi:hypothetical protein
MASRAESVSEISADRLMRYSSIGLSVSGHGRFGWERLRRASIGSPWASRYASSRSLSPRRLRSPSSCAC